MGDVNYISKEELIKILDVEINAQEKVAAFMQKRQDGTRSKLNGMVNIFVAQEIACSLERIKKAIKDPTLKYTLGIDKGGNPCMVRTK